MNRKMIKISDLLKISGGEEMTTDHQGCLEGGADRTEGVTGRTEMIVRMIGTEETEDLTEGEGGVGVLVVLAGDVAAVVVEGKLDSSLTTVKILNVHIPKICCN